MPVARINPGRQKAMMFFCAQAALMLVAAAGFWLFSSLMAAVSALVGGGISLIANGYFAYRLFRHEGAQSAQKIVRAFYAGEAQKLLIIAGLFTIVFAWGAWMPLPVLCGFIITQLGFWLAPMIFK